jgi:hypothetical protein
VPLCPLTHRTTTPPCPLTSPSRPPPPEAVDDDGALDVVTTGRLDNSVRLHLNDGGVVPAFTTIIISDTLVGSWPLAVGDFNGDGREHNAPLPGWLLCMCVCFKEPTTTTLPPFVPVLPRALAL